MTIAEFNPTDQPEATPVNSNGHRWLPSAGDVWIFPTAHDNQKVKILAIADYQGTRFVLFCESDAVPTAGALVCRRPIPKQWWQWDGVKLEPLEYDWEAAIAVRDSIYKDYQGGDAWIMPLEDFMGRADDGSLSFILIEPCQLQTDDVVEVQLPGVEGAIAAQVESCEGDRVRCAVLAGWGAIETRREFVVKLV